MDGDLALWGISWDSIKEKAKALKDKVAEKAKALKDKVKDKFSSSQSLVSPMTAYNNYMSCISKCGATDVSCYQSCATVYQNELMD